MLDLLILLVQATLMVLLVMSPFFIGFGILFYSVHFIMNGKPRAVFRKVLKLREQLKAKQAKEKEAISQGKFEIVKVNGKHILKVGVLKHE